MTTPNYETWLTKQQAADKLGVTTKTVEAFAAKKLLRAVAGYRRLSGGPRVTIFDPDQVENLAHRRGGTLPPASPDAPAPPVEVVPAPVKSVAKISHPAAAPSTRTLIEALAAAIGENSGKKGSYQTSQVALIDKLYLTIPEAARLSGFTETRIRRLCQQGSLKAVKDGGWKIRRASLMEFEL